MIDYGTDLSLAGEFSPQFATVSGPIVVLQAVYRRWTTPEDSVAGARIYGSACRDIRRLLGSRYDAATLSSWEHDLAEISKEDERVETCVVRLQAEVNKILYLRARITVVGVTSSLVIPFDTFDPVVIIGDL